MSQNQEPEIEKFPVHKDLKVLKGVTIFKTSKWWEAVLLVESSFGQTPYKKVTWYRWQWKKMKRFGTGEEFIGWSRKEHKSINFVKNWEDAKRLIDEYSKELQK